MVRLLTAVLCIKWLVDLGPLKKCQIVLGFHWTNPYPDPNRIQVGFKSGFEDQPLWDLVAVLLKLIGLLLICCDCCSLQLKVLYGDSDASKDTWNIFYETRKGIKYFNAKQSFCFVSFIQHLPFPWLSNLLFSNFFECWENFIPYLPKNLELCFLWYFRSWFCFLSMP